MIPQGASSAVSGNASSVLRPIVGSPSQPRLAARLLARARCFSLDGKLVDGANPARSTLLAARAAELTSKSSRDSLARALERVLASVEEPVRRTRVRPRRVAVLANESKMHRLAERLRSDEPLYARGIAHLSALLGNVNSSVFLGDAETLAAELETADAELSGDARPRLASARPRSPADTRPIRRDPAGFVGGSILLPNGSWYHTRREGA